MVKIWAFSPRANPKKTIKRLVYFLIIVIVDFANFCHSERSEEPGNQCVIQILYFAQNDKKGLLYYYDFLSHNSFFKEQTYGVNPF